jgi:hypothetical protein
MECLITLSSSPEMRQVCGQETDLSFEYSGCPTCTNTGRTSDPSGGSPTIPELVPASNKPYDLTKTVACKLSVIVNLMNLSDVRIEISA